MLHEPFPQVAIRLDDGRVYALTGRYDKELRSLLGKRVAIKGRLSGQNPERRGGHWSKILPVIGEEMRTERKFGIKGFLNPILIFPFFLVSYSYNGRVGSLILDVSGISARLGMQGIQMGSSSPAPIIAPALSARRC